jgi:hypothetical protein
MDHLSPCSPQCIATKNRSTQHWYTARIHRDHRCAETPAIGRTVNVRMRWHLEFCYPRRIPLSGPTIRLSFGESDGGLGHMSVLQPCPAERAHA